MSKFVQFPCPKCGKRTLRNEAYDARYCPKCRVWTEEKCEDPKCSFCTIRPETPPPRKP